METNECPSERVSLKELGIGENYDLFLAVSMFKIGALNLFSTKHPLRYRKNLNFEACLELLVKTTMVIIF